MKTLSKLLAILLAVSMLVALVACGEESSSSSSESASAGESGSGEEKDSSESDKAGTYTFEYLDEYGDSTEFTLTLRDTGKVYVMYDGALGSETLDGDGWKENSDGTVTTDKLSGDLPVDWVESDGSITWEISGETATPKGYTAPTEFKEKPYTDPTTAAEAAGIYTFGFVNDYGATVPYVLWLNANGTYDIYMISDWVGAMHYWGDAWTINDASVVSLGPASYDNEEPKTDGNGAYWFSDDTYESSWTLSGDKTCVPVGYDGTVGELDLETLDEACYPAGADKVGVYTFGFVNDYGATVPYVIWLNGDHTAYIYMVSDWVGTMEYDGNNWTVNDDGSVTISDMTWFDEEPKTDGNGAYWFADDTYESTWELDTGKKTAVPTNYEGTVGEIDLATLPADIYPTDTSDAGTYYFGFVNDYGALTPYAVKLREDNRAMIIMDSDWVGPQSYEGDWVRNDDGSVTISNMSYEGEAPRTDGNGATWFDETTYESTWEFDGIHCTPKNYDGPSETIDETALSEDAVLILDEF